jgi:hypothetical protein
MEVMERYNILSFDEEKIYFLRLCDFKKENNFVSARWSIFENVVTDWLSNTNIDRVTVTEINQQEESKSLGKLKVRRLVRENIPNSFEELEEDVLYRPRTPTFPICQMFYKEEDTLVCIQVSIEKSGIRTIKLKTIYEFQNQLKGLEINQIRYKYCPLPQLAEKAKVNFQENVTESMRFQWSVWKFPLLYSDKN